jgi:hypothetical protein
MQTVEANNRATYSRRKTRVLANIIQCHTESLPLPLVRIRSPAAPSSFATTKIHNAVFTQRTTSGRSHARVICVPLCRQGTFDKFDSCNKRKMCGTSAADKTVAVESGSRRQSRLSPLSSWFTNNAPFILPPQPHPGTSTIGFQHAGKKHLLKKSRRLAPTHKRSIRYQTPRLRCAYARPSTRTVTN